MKDMKQYQLTVKYDDTLDAWVMVTGSWNGRDTYVTKGSQARGTMQIKTWKSKHNAVDYFNAKYNYYPFNFKLVVQE